ncbi:hypothetical protein HK102_011146 [Quaeritorhiza haematococci]|nr:hypothetical protein HK102_011146 [Quaeritorhiza haematococci]
MILSYLSKVALVAATGMAYVGARPANVFVVPDSLDHFVAKQNRVIVEFNSPPEIARDLDFNFNEIRTLLHSEHDMFEIHLQNAGIQHRKHAQTTAVLNTMVLDVEDVNDVDRIATLPGVKAVYPVLSVPPPDPIVNPQSGETLVKRDLNAHALTRLYKNGIRNTTLTGRGIKVGIIDTGVDYSHPALGRGFGPNFKVAYGYDFVGDNYTSGNDPVPDNDPMDCGGHGTHGIIGADLVSDVGISGVAPNATLGAYRIFGCSGGTDSSIIISALERAYLDGMDIINLSLGGSSPFPDFPDARAASALVAKGIIVVAAAGNSGSSGLWTIGSPAVGRNVTAVASVDNGVVRRRAFTLEGDTTNRRIAVVHQEGQPPNSKDSAIIKPSSLDTSVANDGCNPYPAGTFTGSIALIRRGTCSFDIKAVNAQNAGAIAIIIYNNIAGEMGSILVQTATIPWYTISGDNGKYAVEFLKTRTSVKALFLDIDVALPSATPGTMSSFSSWGLSSDLSIKPQLAAPGGGILSTWPTKLANPPYAILSGTSMATPYVAGTYALMLQKHRNERTGLADPESLLAILSNTAIPVKYNNSVPLPVMWQGAGLIQIDNALSTSTIIRPPSLSLGATTDGQLPQPVLISITNLGASKMKYTLSNSNSFLITVEDPTQPTFVQLPPGYADVTFNPPSVVVEARSTEAVHAVILPFKPSNMKNCFYSGYVTVTDEQNNQFVVPYGGMLGAYNTMDVLNRDEFGPYLQSPLYNQYYYEPTDTVTVGFSSTQDIIVLLFHLQLPCPQAQFILVDANSQTDVGVLGAYTYLPPNDRSDEQSYWPFVWRDGSVYRGGRKVQVANGTYRISLRLKRPKQLWSDVFDRGTVPDDVWLSPMIQVRMR